MKRDVGGSTTKPRKAQVWNVLSASIWSHKAKKRRKKKSCQRSIDIHPHPEVIFGANSVHCISLFGRLPDKCIAAPARLRPTCTYHDGLSRQSRYGHNEITWKQKYRYICMTCYNFSMQTGGGLMHHKTRVCVRGQYFKVWDDKYNYCNEHQAWNSTSNVHW